MPNKENKSPLESSGMDIPDYAIERMARCLLPMMQKYYETSAANSELDSLRHPTPTTNPAAPSLGRVLSGFAELLAELVVRVHYVFTFTQDDQSSVIILHVAVDTVQCLACHDLRL